MVTQISIGQAITSDKGVGEKVDWRCSIKPLAGVLVVLSTIAMIVDNQRATSLMKG
jgi:hypothetical protein